MSRICSVLETCLYTSDLKTTAAFYRDVLGLEEHSRLEDRHVFFKLRSGMLLIFAREETRKAGGELPPHGATGPVHVAFALPQDQINHWRKRLSDHNVAIEKEYSWPEGRQSLYFRDPAGNSLELVSPGIWGFDESHQSS